MPAGLDLNYTSEHQERAIGNIVAQAMMSMKRQAASGPTLVTAKDRQSKMSKLAAKEALLSRWLRTEGGLMKIAANLANPVRQFLDYKGIARKFVIVEQIPDGIPIYFDKDLPKVPATRIGSDGSNRIVEMTASRTYVEPFALTAKPKIPYDQLYTLKYRPIARTKDRLIEGIELQEDLLWFSLWGSNATLFNTAVTTTGKFLKQDLADVFAKVEDHRLVVRNVLMSAFGTSAIRSWQFQDLDQLGMQEVRETGYLGTMWGANFWVSDQIPKGTVYVICDPKFFAWQPIRKDLEVIPANDPDNFWLGFNGYLLESMLLFNPLGIAQLNFTLS